MKIFKLHCKNVAIQLISSVQPHQNLGNNSRKKKRDYYIFQDQFDTIDFSNNEIRKFDGFPYLHRLKSILVNNNRIRYSSLYLSLPLSFSTSSFYSPSPSLPPSLSLSLFLSFPPSLSSSLPIFLSLFLSLPLSLFLSFYLLLLAIIILSLCHI